MLGEELVDAESYLGSLFRVGPVEAMGTGSTVEYFVVELLSFGLESAYHMLYFHYVHVIVASIGMSRGSCSFSACQTGERRLYSAISSRGVFPIWPSSEKIFR